MYVIASLVSRDTDRDMLADVFIVVRPELNEEGHMGFRLGAVWREGVSACKPEFSSRLLSREQLREILLTKGASCTWRHGSLGAVLNGHLAAQKGPGLAKMYSRPRKYEILPIMAD